MARSSASLNLNVERLKCSQGSRGSGLPEGEGAEAHPVKARPAINKTRNFIAKVYQPGSNRNAGFAVPEAFAAPDSCVFCDPRTAPRAPHRGAPGTGCVERP